VDIPSLKVFKKVLIISERISINLLLELNNQQIGDNLEINLLLSGPSLLLDLMILFNIQTLHMKILLLELLNPSQEEDIQKKYLNQRDQRERKV
jgi:hypothetical protein